jgi:hypothetical protein
MIVHGCIEIHPKWLHIMDYCNWVDGFINYTLSNPKNISGGDIKYPCKKCKNKKFLDQDIVMMHLLQKEFIAKFMCWFVHKKPYVPYVTMIKMMVVSTFNFSNVH